jgi:hypothetical protein
LTNVDQCLAQLLALEATMKLSIAHLPLLTIATSADEVKQRRTLGDAAVLREIVRVLTAAKPRQQ